MPTQNASLGPILLLGPCPGIAEALAIFGHTALRATSVAGGLANAGDPDTRFAVIDASVPIAEAVKFLDLLAEIRPHACAVLALPPGADSSDRLYLDHARAIGAAAILMPGSDPAALLTALAQKGYGQAKHARRAIVVDDTATVREIYRAVLAKAGYDIFAFETFDAALESPEAIGVDLAIIDIFMPGISGIEAIRVVRRGWRGTKILAVSAGLEGRMEASTTLQAADRLGADRVLQKPIDGTRLVGVARELAA
ncbi:MAG: response regulator [Alphaproteobacteria bacterium]|nr:response regulator [Alphaproteobacteria bacterium]MCA0451826.1 response regulator [Pseudomonadota bacterium]